MSRSALLWLLFLTGLPGVSCSQTGVRPEAETESSTPSSAPASSPDLVNVPAGPFFFGVTETQLQFFLSQTKVAFPGIIDQIRETLIIPPEDRYQKAFRINRFEVTNREFKSFLDATGYSPPDRQNFLTHWKGKSYPEWAADFPVVWVSEIDASRYCQWRGGSLPTEAQWEKAARGGTDRRAFPWGEIPPEEGDLNVSSKQVEPVGNRPRDVSPYQVYDLGGNVAEWTSSHSSEKSDLVVIRGGSFLDNSRFSLVGVRLRSASPKQRFEDVGFRCVTE